MKNFKVAAAHSNLWPLYVGIMAPLRSEAHQMALAETQLRDHDMKNGRLRISSLQSPRAAGLFARLFWGRQDHWRSSSLASSEDLVLAERNNILDELRLKSCQGLL